MHHQPNCRTTRRREIVAPPEYAAADPIHDSTTDPLAHLRFIRETMERSNAFTAVPGWGQVIIGATALAASYIASHQFTSTAWTFTWLIEACLAATIASFAMNLKSQRLGVPMISGPGRKFLLGFLPPLVAGAVVTIILYRASMVRSLPGVWALIYGGAVISGGVLSVPIVPVMGACFMAIGAAALLLPAFGNWAMALSFGALHILFGYWIARKHGG